MIRSKNVRSTLVALAVALALTTFAFSEPALAASSQNPIQLHEEIVLTSTSGVYLNMTDGGPTVVGPASGTMTLEVVGGGTPPIYLLTLKSGSVDLGSERIPFQSGSAFMNNQETLIHGAGRVAGTTPSGKIVGGVFAFHAFVVGPSVAHLHPLDFSVLIIHLRIGADQYVVLLQVTTSIIIGS